MSELSDPLRLVLQLDNRMEPIRGTVADGDGRTREYVGWLALINALQELRSELDEEEQCPVSPSP